MKTTTSNKGRKRLSQRRNTCERAWQSILAVTDKVRPTPELLSQSSKSKKKIVEWVKETRRTRRVGQL